jgi:hypothetical protein
MRRQLALLSLPAAILCAPLPLRAQAPVELVTRTISLEYLTPADAARLVAPYVQSAKGGAFSAGEAVRAITVRETPARLAEIESLIRKQDHAPERQAVRLHFQLIRADASAERDERIADVDSTLRKLLRVTGLHLEGEAVTQVDEGAHFQVGMAKAFTIDGDCRSVEPGIEGRVRIVVSLERPKERSFPTEPPTETLIGTGLTVSYGQNAILGTTSSDGVTYVLSVRAEPILQRR